MSGIEIMKNLFFFERGFLNCNHFVYRSEEPILIDTGYFSGYRTTQRLLMDLGVDPSGTRVIISTHTHSDHIGGNKLVQDRSGCEIWLHKLGKYFIETRDDWSTWWRYYGHQADFFTCTRGLDDGEVISIGPHEFQVIHTPGHASDGIVLYNKEEKALISSDTLWEHDVATITVRVEGSTAPFQLLESLEKLQALDVRIVYPGHGPPFENFKRALRKSRKKVEAYMNHREKVGEDLLKKIIIYTLLMHKQIIENEFFDDLMKTPWFRETIDLYFNGEYHIQYDHIMTHFLKRGIVKREDGQFHTTVKP